MKTANEMLTIADKLVEGDQKSMVIKKLCIII